MKINGAMIGMHRDKGGASTVAGFFEVLNHLKPKGIKVVGLLPFVRNAIGPGDNLTAQQETFHELNWN